jgi:hypothetical protein
VNAAVFGTGRGARAVVDACHSGDIHVRCAVTTSPRKVGRDFGVLARDERSGIGVTDRLQDLTENQNIDVLLYCGLGGDLHLATLRYCADAGIDVVTIAGLVHPVTALGAAAALDLSQRASRGGARIIGAGMNPGFLLDLLPAMLATTVSSPECIRARRVSEIRTWGVNVLRHEVGVGKTRFAAPTTFGNAVRESMYLLADASGFAVDRVEDSSQPLISKLPHNAGDLEVSPGTVMGFECEAVAWEGAKERVHLEWVGAMDVGSGDAPYSEGAEVSIEGDSPIRASVAGGFSSDPYPATASRAVHTVHALQKLPPGLYRPDQAPISTLP